MPLSYQFEGSLLHVVVEGTYEFADVEKLFQAACADPAYPERAFVLVDGRQSEANPSADDMQQMVRLAASMGARLGPRVALVVTRDLHFGLGRMLGAFGERHGLRFETFRDLEEARAWLIEIPEA